MSKEKPEVFDLWEDEDGRVYLVVKTTHKYIHLMTKTLTGRKLTFKQYVRHHITNHWKYICKSKVSIKELFDVEI